MDWQASLSTTFIKSLLMKQTSYFFQVFNWVPSVVFHSIPKQHLTPCFSCEFIRFEMLNFHKLINYIILKTHNNANKIEFYCIPQRSWGPRIFAIYDYSLTECTAWVLILNTNFLISFCLQQYISGLTNEFIMANVCIKASLIMQTS